jgi:hypothetical protein
MNPKAEEFILDVRRAVRTELRPTVTTDSQLIDPESVAGAFQRATLWLTPKIVEVYDPAAFSAWPGDLQAELRAAVEGFREVAAKVAADKPATALQLREGVQAFARLKEAVQKVALSEWLHEGGGLINRVEAWAKGFGWETRQQGKKLNEMMLGEYTLAQLYMYAEGNLYILDPVARFNPGGLGGFDLSIQPSFYVTSIYRHMDGVWYIPLDVGQGVWGAKEEQLSAEALKRAVGELRSLL